MVNLFSLEAKASQVRFALASMVMSVAVAEKSDRIPPAPDSFAAKFALELHQKFGGDHNVALAKAIGDFFETFDPEQEAPGWQNDEYLSPDWIC